MAMTSRLVTHSTYNSIGRTPGLDTHPDDGPDLGLATSIDPHLNIRKHGADQRNFYLIPVDDTTRINERTPASSEGGEAAELSTSPRKPSTVPRGVDGFFGLALETRLGTKGPKSAVFGTEDEAMAGRTFVAYEPCRVGVEFFGVGNLKDKQRLYSSTFFYAGVSVLIVARVSSELRSLTFALFPSPSSTSTSSAFKRRERSNSASTSIAKTRTSLFLIPLSLPPHSARRFWPTSSSLGRLPRSSEASLPTRIGGSRSALSSASGVPISRVSLSSLGRKPSAELNLALSQATHSPSSRVDRISLPSRSPGV